ncbi:MAG: branched-chain amino acid ABC transporter permease [Betaproteobacteria bacterium]|nr:branched-chain amino acid ABC transporter permease [Betaproteobacteria bacterium]
MFVDQLINGLVSGGLYALIEIGYTLVFGVLEKLNFADGEIFMFGGYADVIALSLGGDLTAAVLLTIAVSTLLALVVEFVSFRKFRSADAQITAALSSLLVGLILIELTHNIFSSEPRSLGLPQEVYSAGVNILGVQIAWIKLVILGAALVLMVGLSFVLERTRLGRNIRAVSDSPESAALSGINVQRVTQQVFVIASILAGIGGLLVACKSGVAVAEVGLTFGLKALAVMAIGGMGDLRGAVVA